MATTQYTTNPSVLVMYMVQGKVIYYKLVVLSKKFKCVCKYVHRFTNSAKLIQRRRFCAISVILEPHLAFRRHGYRCLYIGFFQKRTSVLCHYQGEPALTILLKPPQMSTVSCGQNVRERILRSLCIRNTDIAAYRVILGCQE